MTTNLFYGDIMIEKLFIHQESSLDPYYNLALEKQLLDALQPGMCILYLWQNRNTVVIGKNQNAWAECRTSLLEAEGGHLARRLSGGGAVFHDTGNLNFTFLVCDEDYDVDKQLSVIQKACEYCGITAEKSGRNDLLADGRKFSGNAFYHQSGHAYHHGTLMVTVDKDKLQRYLSPSKAKLDAKGVASVRSRVVNLSELAPGLTCDTMRELMVKAFEEVYGLLSQPITLTEEDAKTIEATRQVNASWEHLFGANLPFSFECEDRFPWGGVQLQLAADGGVITAVKVYSDSMDWQLSSKLEDALTGVAFHTDDLCRAIRAEFSDPKISADLCGMIKNQNI